LIAKAATNTKGSKYQPQSIARELHYSAVSPIPALWPLPNC
jgi:hypothetical protein